MSTPLLTFKAPDLRALDRLVQREAGRPLSYPHTGASRADSALPGYRVVERSVLLAAGGGTWARAAGALRCWQVHTAAGMRVHPRREVEVGATVALVVPVGVLRAVATCRVVWVAAESDRYGFAYGTLPHHPLRGEEAFVVERADDGAVRFTVRAVWRPRPGLVPLGRAVQAVDQRLMDRYLDAMQRCAR